jgi:hypothetical protein
MSNDKISQAKAYYKLGQKLAHSNLLKHAMGDMPVETDPGMVNASTEYGTGGKALPFSKLINKLLKRK